jgi:tetratricopeptide (TPR) repeat protein
MKAFNFITALFAALIIISCSSPKQKIAEHWAVYEFAMEHGDVTSAVNQMSAILAFDTTNQSAIDTLARLYFIQGNSLGAYKLANKIADKNSDHKQIIAETAIALGYADEAKKYLLELNAADTTGENIANKYKLATLHFSAEELKEAIVLLGEITANENSTKQSTRVNLDGGGFQDISLYAASWNFAGYIQTLVQDFDAAEQYYDEALRASPNFILAKNNKERLKEQRISAANAGEQPLKIK